jgi:hypothetical protein
MRSLDWRQVRSGRVAGLVVGALFLVAVAPGCGGSPQQAELDTSAEAQGLKNLGKMYRIVSESLKRPPKTINELRKAEAQVPGGFNSIGETNVGIYFDVQMADASGKPGAETSEAVLAYDRMVPMQGGFVLMLDGSVRRISASEFKTAKKAGKTAWLAPPGS